MRILDIDLTAGIPFFQTNPSIRHTHGGLFGMTYLVRGNGNGFKYDLAKMTRHKLKDKMSLNKQFQAHPRFSFRLARFGESPPTAERLFCGSFI